ncbi:MAG: cytochrome c biogenesis protein ResB [Pseudomonadota bacterium]
MSSTSVRIAVRQQFYALLSSMRFAVSLLTVIAIASVIGTVLKQGEPYTNYAFQFGQFWFQLFHLLGLFDVYHTGWFLIILAFLVLSTSLCVYRNTPAMLKEMRTFKEKASETSLRNFAHRAEFLGAVKGNAVQTLRQYLEHQGFRSKVVERPEGQTLIAAKAGTQSRWGYLFAHMAIVIICLGGLMDGNLPLQLQQFMGTKKIETRDIPQSQIPPQSRLSSSNLSFRANVTVPEGSVVDVGFQSIEDGYFVQELPFTIELKKFHIEHYSTGQPKAFASDIIVTDKQTGEKVTSTIEVNKPLIYGGVAIYQASFADGGTGLKLKAWNLAGQNMQPLALNGRINQVGRLTSGDVEYTIEFNDFRPFNIENFGPTDEQKNKADGQSASSTRASHILSSLPSKKNLHNVGPSFQFKFRNPQGQAREYNNYMQPVQLDGHSYFLTGVRENPGEAFRFMRIPADDQGSVDGFMRLKAVLVDQTLRKAAAQRFVNAAMKGDAISEVLREKLLDSTDRVLTIFAKSGFEGVAQFLEKAVPAAEQQKAAETYLKILEGASLQAFDISRERAGLKPLPIDDSAMSFVRDALTAMNDFRLYGSPVYLQLASFDEVKASGFQLTRSPGKSVVYFGSILLVVGIFAMFYIRERRLFLLVKPGESQVLFAMSTNRKTLDFEREFEKHRATVGEILKA